MECGCIFFNLLCIIVWVFVISSKSNCEVLNKTNEEKSLQNKQVVRSYNDQRSGARSLLAYSVIKDKGLNENLNTANLNFKPISELKSNPKQKNIHKKINSVARGNKKQNAAIHNTDNLELAKFVRKGISPTNKNFDTIRHRWSKLSQISKGKRKFGSGRKLNSTIVRNDDVLKDSLDNEIAGTDFYDKHQGVAIAGENDEKEKAHDDEIIESVGEKNGAHYMNETESGNEIEEVEEKNDAQNINDTESVNDVSELVDGNSKDRSIHTSKEETGNKSYIEDLENNESDNSNLVGALSTTTSAWRTKCSTKKPLPDFDKSFLPTSVELESGEPSEYEGASDEDINNSRLAGELDPNRKEVDASLFANYDGEPDVVDKGYIRPETHMPMFYVDDEK